ncbi:MAG: Maf family protein, partial [Wenzhouxiangellaceae bacterium]
MTSPPPLILASGSIYRAAMLERLGLPFRVVASDLDETAQPAEAPDRLVIRLATGKAAAVARNHPEAIVIGADQLAVLDSGEIMGKPGDRAGAVAQLRRMSGRTVDFLSAIALCGAVAPRSDIIPTRLKFRTLDDAEIERYVDRDRPYDCAGAMRSESLGITLLDSMTSDDPSALIGLPLIRISQWLR